MDKSSGGVPQEILSFEQFLETFLEGSSQQKILETYQTKIPGEILGRIPEEIIGGIPRRIPAEKNSQKDLRKNF